MDVIADTRCKLSTWGMRNVDAHPRRASMHAETPGGMALRLGGSDTPVRENTVQKIHTFCFA